MFTLSPTSITSASMMMFMASTDRSNKRSWRNRAGEILECLDELPGDRWCGDDEIGVMDQPVVVAARCHFAIPGPWS